MTTPVDGSATIEPTVPGGTGTTTTVTGNTANTVFTSPVSMTREELDRQLAEARRTGERTAKESEEIKGLRAKAKRADELEALSKSDIDKALDRATAAEARGVTLEGKYKTALILAAFTTKALADGIPPDRIDGAYRLADLSAVSVDEDSDEVKGIADALKAVPAWVKAADPGTPVNGQRRPAPNINAGEQGRERTKEEAILLARQEMAQSGKYGRL